ncbi:MAG: dipeptide epimerase [candidate division KSB1 bacterium]|nr:dipeptide epimerase [candidate division KSB1 bacterium]
MEPQVGVVIHPLVLRHTFRVSRAASDVVYNVFLRLRLEGIEGYGEAAPIRRYSESAEETAALLGGVSSLLPSDPWNLQELHERLDQAWGGKHFPARAAVEMALLDWAGKQVGAPLYQLWGLDPRRVPQTSFTLGLDTVERMLAKLDEASAYPILKIKVGGREDLRIVEAIRKRTDRPLRVDANEGWKREEAAQKIRALQDLGVEFVEQPLPADDLEGMRWLRDRVDLPLIADESVHHPSDVPKLAGLFDGINIKLAKCGGLWAARELIAVARAHGMKVMLGCMVESSLGITAVAQLAPLADYLDLDGHLLIRDDPFTGLQLSADGRPILPPVPGLGAEPRLDLFCTARVAAL